MDKTGRYCCRRDVGRKTMGKTHWNAVMGLYLHSHWEPIRLRNPNALCKSCWMLCIFCSSSYRGACFQFVPLVRHQSAYFDTLSGIFRKCNSANAFWTRYLETAIGWRFRIVQKNTQMSYMAVFIIVPPKQWDGQICQRLIFTVEPARWLVRDQILQIQIRILLYTTWHRTRTDISTL